MSEPPASFVLADLGRITTSIAHQAADAVLLANPDVSPDNPNDRMACLEVGSGIAALTMMQAAIIEPELLDDILSRLVPQNVANIFENANRAIATWRALAVSPKDAEAML